MAKQTVNLGTSANKGDGDPLRTAFDKVNDNFTEVYSLLGAEGGDVDDVVAPMLVHSDHTNVTVTRDDAANKIIFSVDPYDGDITGSVFGDDSTLLVDGVNNTIPKANVESSTNWDTAYGWGDHSTEGYLTSVAFGDLTTTPTTLAGYGITDAATTAQGALADTALQIGDVFDVKGSVFGDDSTLLVDAVIGVIPYPANAGVSWDGVAPTTVDGALDRLASYTQDFAVSTDAHWADPDPTGITDAINRLAAAIYALNGNTGI